MALRREGDVLYFSSAKLDRADTTVWDFSAAEKCTGTKSWCRVYNVQGSFFIIELLRLIEVDTAVGSSSNQG